MVIIPYEVDVPYDRRPVINWVIVSVCVIIFILQNQIYKEQKEKIENRWRSGQEVTQEDWKNPFESLIMYGWSLKGLFGHMWLHGGWIHLIGNLIFLWLFGNAICSKIGNIIYLPIYILLGLTAAAFHQTFSGGPAIGASGAINGIVGMYLVFFPENSVSCFFMFWFPLFVRPYTRTFSVSGIWVILLYFVYDIWGLTKGGGHVAYWAHIGGFATGFGLALLMLLFKQITIEKYEKSLLEVIGLHKKPPIFDQDYLDRRRDLGYWQREAIEQESPLSGPPDKVPTETIPLTGNGGPELPPILTEHENTRKPPVSTDDALAAMEREFVSSAKPTKKASQSLQRPENLYIRAKCLCGKKFKVPLSFSGRKLICPNCKRHLKIPDKNFVHMTCSCGKTFKVPVILAGRYGKCPKCKKRLKIPDKSD